MELKQPTVRSKKHRMWISTLPCCVCRVEGITQAAHIRTGNGAGMGLKSGDNHVLPLCIRCHAEQHRYSEKKYWGVWLEDAQTLANVLFVKSGDTDYAIKMIERFQK
jgi:hypothetical protein